MRRDLTLTHAPSRERGLGWGFLGRGWGGGAAAASALSPHPDLGINSHPASNVPPGSSYSQILIPLLGTGLVLGLGVVGWACWRRR